MTDTSNHPLLLFLLTVYILELVSGVRLPSRRLQKRSQISLDIEGVELLKTYVCSPDTTDGQSDSLSLQRRIDVPTDELQTLIDQANAISAQLSALLGEDTPYLCSSASSQPPPLPSSIHPPPLISFIPGPPLPSLIPGPALPSIVPGPPLPSSVHAHSSSSTPTLVPHPSPIKVSMTVRPITKASGTGPQTAPGTTGGPYRPPFPDSLRPVPSFLIGRSNHLIFRNLQLTCDRSFKVTDCITNCVDNQQWILLQQC